MIQSAEQLAALIKSLELSLEVTEECLSLLHDSIKACLTEAKAAYYTPQLELDEDPF